MEKYIILSEKKLEKLTEIVNEKIEEGYTPCGGVSSYFDTWLMPHFMQAMHRDK